MLEHALKYAARGWRVHPLKGKLPILKDWPNRATTDEQTVRKWWTENPDANIGLATGGGSGFFCIDLDGERGEASWLDLCASIPELNRPTLAASTSQGRHLYFIYPALRDVRNRQHVRPGIDVRGDGGYVVAPPSVHPSGAVYAWLYRDDPPLFEAPTDLLDVIAPRATRRPWDPPPVDAPTPPPMPSERPQGTPVLDRASKYLRECEPAVQGSGGHNALLWAARAMVVGFELSDGDALGLLWSEFNPRCSPPWGEDERKDFERKVAEARRTPGEKPHGWLLDEYGLRTGDAALAAIGARLREGLLAGRNKEKDPVETVPAGEFPLCCFPDAIREFIQVVADVQVVDAPAVGLSVLVAAGAAMGNAFLLRLKAGFDVRPVLWGVVVASSGSNKSGPFREIVRPLRLPVPVHTIKEPMLNPQGQLLIEDATTESVLDVLSRSPRGLCLANGELTGWVGSFDRYTQGGGKRAGKSSVDESIWLKLWDGDPYQKNRKTEGENVLIPAASCAVVGCIQPEKLAEAFDPSQFASGLVPRLLVVSVPKRFRGWSEQEMTDEHAQVWHDAVMFLRTVPFAGLDPNVGQYRPRIATLTREAKSAFVGEFNRLAGVIEAADNAQALFAAKAQGMTGRVALVLHGLEAAVGEHGIDEPVSERTMERAIVLAQYLLAEQLRVYGLAGEQFRAKMTEELEAVLRKHANSEGVGTVRSVQRAEISRFPAVEKLRGEIQGLVDAGAVEWFNPRKTAYRIDLNGLARPRGQ